MKYQDDVVPALRAAGLPAARRQSSAGYIPGTQSHIHASLSQLDLTDPDVVSQVLRFTARIAEIYAATPEADRSRLVRLRNALSDDGYSVEPTGDPVAMITGLWAKASALTDTAAVRAELLRLERALPTDPAVAIGRAKNLVEATAKAVLRRYGQPVTDSENMPALVHRASMALGVVPNQVPAGPHREEIVRLLGQVKAITQSLAELRNDVGDGHGASQVPTDITPAHGRLAARAALTWSAFALDLTAV